MLGEAYNKYAFLVWRLLRIQTRYRSALAGAALPYGIYERRLLVLVESIHVDSTCYRKLEQVGYFRAIFDHCNSMSSTSHFTCRLAWKLLST